MQNIHVKRYQSGSAYQGSIEPEDRGWVVFVNSAGEATFWRRVSIERDAEGASVQHGYVDAEISGALLAAGEVPGPVASPVKGFDFVCSQQPDGVWWARLANSRQHPAGAGPTEREAIRDLMNAIAQEVSAGICDHAGEKTQANPRKSEYVWPSEKN